MSTLSVNRSYCYAWTWYLRTALFLKRAQMLNENSRNKICFISWRLRILSAKTTKQNSLKSGCSSLKSLGNCSFKISDWEWNRFLPAKRFGHLLHGELLRYKVSGWINLKENNYFLFLSHVKHSLHGAMKPTILSTVLWPKLVTGKCRSEQYLTQRTIKMLYNDQMLSV